MSKLSRKEQILDAAEKAFAKRGAFGVSLRDIARDSGVDVSLVSYHFGKRADVFHAVIMRRLDSLNAERKQYLDEAKRRAAPELPSLEDVIDAFSHAILNRVKKDGEGWQHYLALIAQMNNNPEWGGDMMNRYFDELVEPFIAALKEILPNSDETDLYWCYHFLSGALTLSFANTGRIDVLSGGLCKSSDFESVHERLVPFICAGFRSLCDKQEKPHE